MYYILFTIWAFIWIFRFHCAFPFHTSTFIIYWSSQNKFRPFCFHCEVSFCVWKNIKLHYLNNIAQSRVVSPFFFKQKFWFPAKAETVKADKTKSPEIPNKIPLGVFLTVDVMPLKKISHANFHLIFSFYFFVYYWVNPTAQCTFAPCHILCYYFHCKNNEFLNFVLVLWLHQR